MFGGGGDSGSSAARRTIVFGVCIGLAFILLLVAGLVSKNWLGCVERQARHNASESSQPARPPPPPPHAA